MVSLIFIFTVNFCIGQKLTNVLDHKKDKYFIEKNILLHDTGISLLQEMCHDIPEVSDDRVCLSLHIFILDSAKAVKLKSIDIIKDSAIIKCNFGKKAFMPDPVNGAKRKLSGTINVIQWKKNSIKLKMDIKVIDEDWNHVYYYRGKRNFTPKY